MSNKEENIRNGFKGMYSILSTTPSKPDDTPEAVTTSMQESTSNDRPSFGRGRPRKNGEGRRAPEGLVYTSLALDASLRKFIDDYAYEERLSMKTVYNELLDLCRRLHACDPESFRVLCTTKDEERLSEFLSSVKAK